MMNVYKFRHKLKNYRAIGEDEDIDEEHVSDPEDAKGSRHR